MTQSKNTKEQKDLYTFFKDRLDFTHTDVALITGAPLIVITIDAPLEEAKSIRNLVYRLEDRYREEYPDRIFDLTTRFRKT